MKKVQDSKMAMSSKTTLGSLLFSRIQEDRMIHSWLRNSCSKSLVFSDDVVFGVSNIEQCLYAGVNDNFFGNTWYNVNTSNARYFLLAAQSCLLEEGWDSTWTVEQYWDDWATLASFLCVMSEEDLEMYLSLQ